MWIYMKEMRETENFAAYKDIVTALSCTVAIMAVAYKCLKKLYEWIWCCTRCCNEPNNRKAEGAEDSGAGSVSDSDSGSEGAEECMSFHTAFDTLSDHGTITLSQLIDE